MLSLVYVYRLSRNMAAYRYRRLDHDRPTFRLLRLHQGIQDDELTCNLFGALLHHDDLIQYEALSYTWGASATPKSVTVDGQKLAITENLHQALINLRRSYTDRILWIDAICIDQGSKKERSHQVAQMGDIYKQADRVIFFLGRATYNTNAFMDCMSYVEQERSKYAYRSWARDDKLWMVVQEAIQEKLNKHDIDILPLGLEDLLNRSWFLRVWILQEVANAKNAIVCCGRKEIEASVFSIAPIIFDVSPSAHCQSVIDIMPGPWRKNSWWSKNPSLYTLLSKFGGAQATEPRDLIYALRGVSTDKESPILTPDYNKSEERLVHDVVRFLFNTEYDAKMAWSTIKTVRDVIRYLDWMKDLIFTERIKTDGPNRLDSLLQAPGFTFSSTNVEVTIQHDETGELMKTLIKHAKGYEISTETFFNAVARSSVPVVQVLEHHLHNGLVAATKEMLLAATYNDRHGDDMILYILSRIQNMRELDDYGLVASVAKYAAGKSTLAAKIVRELLDRGSRITTTSQLYMYSPQRGLYKNSATNVDANISAGDAAKSARLVFRSIVRFWINYAAYDDTIVDMFRHSCRQIEGHEYNVLEELTLCAAEVYKDRDSATLELTRLGQFADQNEPFTWLTKGSGLDFCITIGVVKASIESRLTRGMSRLLAQKGDSVDIDSDAAAEIIRTYYPGEQDIVLTTEVILRYRSGQFRHTKVVSEAFKERYCDLKGRPDGRWLHIAFEYDCFETFRRLLPWNADPDDEDYHGYTLRMRIGDCRIAALHLSQGADPNSHEGQNRNCTLCWAIEGRNYELLELLLACGANPNMVDSSRSNTPLNRAAHADDIELVKLLLRYGANTSARNYKGEGAEDLAKSTAIIRLLRKYSSRSPPRMHMVSPSVHSIMKEHGLVPKSHMRLLGTRLLWHK